jgi:stage V sporulation protein D (sporulation-specific penicillin-binding protein)
LAHSEISVDETNIAEFSYPETGGIVTAEVSAEMREILEKVVSEGSGKNAYLEGFTIGGKTATSETLPRGTGKYIASFLGFAPAQNPQVMALAIIKHPQGMYYGGQIAAPIVRQLFANILPYLQTNVNNEENKLASERE